jgi:tRNA pseudouridine38-40 synthase
VNPVGADPPGPVFEGAARSITKLALVVAYDGTGFHGFAAQSAVRTVQANLADALTRVLRCSAEELDLVCAGRTDAGVHAWGQVVSVNAPPDTDPRRVRHAVNRMIGPEVVVRRCVQVDATFDARRLARWRCYRYTILNQRDPDPFLARYSWWLPEPLEIAQLRLAADPFVGEHDFSSFCRKRPEVGSMTRRVMQSHWLDDAQSDDGVLVYEIRANAFCWQMVRAVVGTMIDAATGTTTPGDVMRIVRAGNRDAARRLAPPQGLCLWKVGY